MNTKVGQKTFWMTALIYILIALGSALYALGTVLFIFPVSLLLGGTSGISVILTSILPFSPGMILMVINFSLLFLAFFILGRDMAVKTLIGSLLTTLFVGLFEKLFIFESPIVSNPYFSALVGASVIALASGVMFYVDSSSGGTDIIALIVKKFTRLKIGRALLFTDILIVLVGGAFLGLRLLLASVLGFLIKTFGIDGVIFVIGKLLGGRSSRE